MSVQLAVSPLTLAITRFGSTSDFVTRLVLRKLNLEGKTELRQFGGVIEADIGYRNGQSVGRLSSQSPGPDARKLVDAAELGIPFSMNLLAVSNDYYRKAPKTVEGIIAAYIEGKSSTYLIDAVIDYKKDSLGGQLNLKTRSPRRTPGSRLPSAHAQ